MICYIYDLPVCLTIWKLENWPKLWTQGDCPFADMHPTVLVGPSPGIVKFRPVDSSNQQPPPQNKLYPAGSAPAACLMTAGNSTHTAHCETSHFSQHLFWSIRWPQAVLVPRLATLTNRVSKYYSTTRSGTSHLMGTNYTSNTNLVTKK